MINHAKIQVKQRQQHVISILRKNDQKHVRKRSEFNLRGHVLKSDIHILRIQLN